MWCLLTIQLHYWDKHINCNLFIFCWRMTFHWLHIFHIVWSPKKRFVIMVNICGTAHPRKCTMPTWNNMNSVMWIELWLCMCHVFVVLYSVTVKGNCDIWNISIFGYFCKITYCCTSQSYFRVTWGSMVIYTLASLSLLSFVLINFFLCVWDFVCVMKFCNRRWTSSPT